MKVKVHELKPGSHFSFYKKGEWIDLRAAETITLHAPQAGTQYERDGKKFRDVNFESTLISLGISMALPKGFALPHNKRGHHNEKPMHHN